MSTNHTHFFQSIGLINAKKSNGPRATNSVKRFDELSVVLLGLDISFSGVNLKADAGHLARSTPLYFYIL